MKTPGDMPAKNMATMRQFYISSPAVRAFANPASISCSVCRNLQKGRRRKSHWWGEKLVSLLELTVRACRHACTYSHLHTGQQPTDQMFAAPPVCTHSRVLTHTHVTGRPWRETQYGKHAFLLEYKRQRKQTVCTYKECCATPLSVLILSNLFRL